MSAREQVADLHEGDVVEIRFDEWPEGTFVRGPVYAVGPGGHLQVGAHCVRFMDGSPCGEQLHLTVVSRAPRPLYVNHDRPVPCPSDVVRSADPRDDADASTWSHLPLFRYEDRPWVCSTSKGEVVRVGRHELPARLRLLVDGEIGQVVQ